MSYKDKKQVLEQPEQLVQPVQLEPNVGLNLPKDDIYKRMKKLTTFKQIKRSYKLESQKAQFLADLDELFKHLNVEDHLYDTELLIELMNATEQYFIYGTKDQRDQSKAEVVKEVMLKFFNNDERVLDKFIATVFKKVKKSTLMRRLYRRVYNFFF